MDDSRRNARLAKDTRLDHPTQLDKRQTAFNVEGVGEIPKSFYANYLALGHYRDKCPEGHNGLGVKR